MSFSKRSECRAPFDGLRAALLVAARPPIRKQQPASPC